MLIFVSEGIFLEDKIYVFLFDVSNLKESDLSFISKELPRVIKEKIEAKKLLKSKLLTAVSYKMLFDFCKEKLGFIPKVKIKSGGKPYFENGGIHFSISHSKNIAVCAISQSEVGIDIERLDKERDYLSLAERYFTKKEYEKIRESENIKEAFIKYWTAKEAYIKYTGEGFKRGMNYFEADFGSFPHFKGENMPSLYTEKFGNEFYLSLVYSGNKNIEIIKRVVL